MEKEFYNEIRNRVFYFAMKQGEQYIKDAKEVDIPEFAKLEEDTLESRVNVWLTGVEIEGRLYEVYNKYILQPSTRAT